MLTLTYRYRIYPQATQQQELIEWMDICRNAYNYGGVAERGMNFGNHKLFAAP